MEIRIGVEGNIVYASPKCEERGYSFVPSYLIFVWIMYMYVFYICLDCVHVFIIFLSLSRLCTVSLYYIFLDCVPGTCFHYLTSVWIESISWVIPSLFSDWMPGSELYSILYNISSLIAVLIYREKKVSAHHHYMSQFDIFLYMYVGFFLCQLKPGETFP